MLTALSAEGHRTVVRALSEFSAIIFLDDDHVNTTIGETNE
jgi:hypothetical protein